MNKLVYLCLPLGLLAAQPAQADLYGNVGVTSDYLWRGLSQSDGSPSVAGGLDYVSDSGFYLGTLISSVDFKDDTSYEVDVYGGYAGEVKGFAFDLGYIYYGYPNAAAEGESYDSDFGEVYAKVNWSWLGLETGYVTNNDDAQEAYKDSFYLAVNAEYGISDTITLSCSVGKTFWDDSYNDDKDYVDYRITLTKATQIGDVYWTISDTNMHKDDPKFVVGWLYAFDL